MSASHLLHIVPILCVDLLTWLIGVLDTTFINEYVPNWMSANESLFPICVGFVL